MRDAILAGFLLSIAACSSRQERLQEKEQSYKVRLDPLIGSGTREQFAKLYGIPMKRETIDGLDYWAWRFRSRKTAEDPLIPRTSTVGNYEELTAVFDSKGILQSWRVTIPR